MEYFVASFHTEYKKPYVCVIFNLCGGKLIQRKDDDPKIVKDRLAVFHEQTEPLKDYYSSKGKLVVVEGQEEVKDTTALTFKAVRGNL